MRTTSQAALAVCLIAFSKRATGSVGVSMTAPLAALDVNGQINTSSGYRYPGGRGGHSAQNTQF
jgi:hypothetical protein